RAARRRAWPCVARTPEPAVRCWSAIGAQGRRGFAPRDARGRRCWAYRRAADARSAADCRESRAPTPSALLGDMTGPGPAEPVPVIDQVSPARMLVHAGVHDHVGVPPLLGSLKACLVVATLPHDSITGFGVPEAGALRVVLAVARTSAVSE